MPKTKIRTCSKCTRDYNAGTQEECPWCRIESDTLRVRETDSVVQLIDSRGEVVATAPTTNEGRDRLARIMMGQDPNDS